MSENMKLKQTGQNSLENGLENDPENNPDAETAEEELRLEDILAQVEYCIGQLENPQISLEDSFRFYEEGIRKLKKCNEKVEQIEQKMLVIGSQGQLEEF